MTREEILTAIRECAEKLGRTPKHSEIQAMFPNVTRTIVRRRFGKMMVALEHLGMKPCGPGFRAPMPALFQSWAAVVRRLGQVPTLVEYELYGGYSRIPLLTRFKSWLNVPKAMERYVMEEGLGEEYQDVLEIIRARRDKDEPARAKTCTQTSAGTTRPRLPKGGRVFGLPLMMAPLAFGPVNEAGVLFLFGMLAERLGFIVTHVQTEFPDCRALVKLDEDTCEELRIELELESRNFREHGHSIKDCDMIVCWVHNWTDCPLEVIELKPILLELLKGGIPRPER